MTERLYNTCTSPESIIATGSAAIFTISCDIKLIHKEPVYEGNITTSVKLSCVDLLCFSVLFLLCLSTRLFICALLWPAGKGLTSWLTFVVSYCGFVTFPLVSWVRCGTWLYRFLIFAPFLTFNQGLASPLISSAHCVKDFKNAKKMKIIIFESRTFLVFFNKLNRLEMTLCLYLYLKPVFL